MPGPQTRLSLGRHSRAADALRISARNRRARPGFGPRLLAADSDVDALGTTISLRFTGKIAVSEGSETDGFTITADGAPLALTFVEVDNSAADQGVLRFTVSPTVENGQRVEVFWNDEVSVQQFEVGPAAMPPPAAEAILNFSTVLP